MNSPGDSLVPCFLGTCGENDSLFEELLLELVHEHMAWRHCDQDIIDKQKKISKSDNAPLIDLLKKQLHQMTAELKQSAPINSTHYFGTMNSDLLLPGLIAQLAATLYNPNNISSEIAPGSVNMELEAGNQIAEMFGYNTQQDKYPCAWGHITSSGTTANYESLWNARAISFYPLALKSAAKKLSLSLLISESSNTLLSQCSSWQCQNFSVDEVISLQKYCYQQLSEVQGKQAAKNFFKQVSLHRVEHMGMAAFFAEHWDAKQPLVLIPAIAHHSWEKAMKLLGFGSSQIIKLDVDHHMRIDIDSLERILNHAAQKKIPILTLVGILGTEEFGSIDPLAEIVKLREYFTKIGLNFYFHIDAAWGGYLCSLFRNEDNSFVSHEELRSQFKYFPSKRIYDAFAAVNESDSVSVAPHKMGYLPFGTGAFISRNRDVTNLISHDSPYVTNEGIVNFKEQLKDLNEYILDGSKPGATAVACCLTHRVLPLNKKYFGQIISQSIHSSEYFYERINKTIENLRPLVNMVIPMEPDSNLFCLAINPINNHCLARMNRFSRRVFKRLQNLPDEPVQDNLFFCSSTSLLHSSLGSEDAHQLLERLGIKDSSYVINIEDPNVQTNSIHVLRHALLNPKLLVQVEGKNAIDRYCEYLEKIVTDVVNKESSNTLITVGAR